MPGGPVPVVVRAAARRDRLPAPVGGRDDRAGFGTAVALGVASYRSPRRASGAVVPPTGGCEFRGGRRRRRALAGGQRPRGRGPISHPRLAPARGGTLLFGPERRGKGGGVCRRPRGPRSLPPAGRTGRGGLTGGDFFSLVGWREGWLFVTGRRTSMDFRPLNDTERRQLISALRGNAESDRTILMDRRNTSFIGTTDEVTDEEVISAI